MHHSALRWLLSALVHTFLVSFTVSDPRITESGLFCGTSRPSPAKSASFVPTFVKEMEALSKLINDAHFATYHVNSTVPIYALAQCHYDLSQTDCLLCYASSRTKLPRCLPSVSGRIYFDGCFLRYDNYSFFQESVSSHMDAAKCSNESVQSIRDGIEKSDFVTYVGYAIANVTSKAVAKGGFGVVRSDKVYALAQCWDSVGKEGCRECLEMAGKAAKSCLPNREGRGMNAGCYLRYSTEKFYNEGGNLENGHGFSGLGVTIAVVLAVAAFLMLSIFATYASYLRLSRIREERNNLGKISISFNKSSLSFKYETLEKATDYFSPSRRLGQGGAGSVYMGTLPNGQTVAVKRLIFNTRQWVDDFFNEVNLISGIQHKNLVKLLGCSIEGPESLLVYEYVRNKSLDLLLFDKNKNRILNWEERFEIIVGTAEGLAYLHGGSPVRIIHRDIKSSNLLLDETLTPKIADFGLVRCFGPDKTHLSTGIAGTVGYMAPEYLIRGQLTDKADVYSYGVLVLEIVSGKRCNALAEDSASLLQMVWQLYRSNRPLDAVDPCLRDDFPVQSVSRVLQIGLLCAQASVALRPSMAQVVEMLSKEDCELPMPNQPPFITNTGMLGAESFKKSYITMSTEFNTATKVGASDSSSDSYSLPSLHGIIEKPG
ncbi:hypothetical protein K2173_014145 [Erythroxylum novogranatense]|uniref:Cysteine-rich receptor-like protein kinase 42 n=1 Tax=Erythroxylum novogranatense TaxID=1862640 RepID=A0AAV8SDV7_9ROSI|nr:hypothetical protein K2173_014145 [Erythroxylum novogranatense]